MKIIGSVKEDLNLEKRISLTPETLKKLNDLKFKILIEENYGEHLGIHDKEFKQADILKSSKEVLEKSDIVLTINFPSLNNINFFKEGSILIGQFDSNSNKDNVQKLLKKKYQDFFIKFIAQNYKSSINGCSFFTSKSSWL